MSLPQSAEYDEAIQNSRSAFIDAELKNATNDGPLLMGVPGGPVASGNFAIVYRFRTGKRRLAVKCFTREKTDQQRRYQLIHDHLAAQKLPWTIDFTFLKEGIRVKGKTYPIVKMEWIENAKTLLSHINGAIIAEQPLGSVCDQFYRMTSDLRKHSIAHGDLQHANLIMSDGKLLLIDYDGMCVPGTVGLKSEEDGLPDYQHPRRHGGILRSTMDNFSTLVIWTSLHALTIDPSLWKRWVRDDERLLFSRADFTRPDNSALIRELLSFCDPKMNSAVEAIVRAAGATSLEEVPHLVEVVKDEASLDTAPWWQPAVTVAEQVVSQGPGEPKSIPAWITASTTMPLQPVVFRGATPVLSSYSAISIAFVLIAGILGLGSGMAAPVAFVFVSATVSVYCIVLRLAFLRRAEALLRANAIAKLSEALSHHLKAAELLKFKQAPYLAIIADHERKIGVSEVKMIKVEAAIDAIKKRTAKAHQSFANDQAEKRSRAEKAERDAVSLSIAKKSSAKSHYDLHLRQIDQDRASAEAHFTAQANLLSSQAERNREAKFAAKFDALIQSEMAKIKMMEPFGSLDNFMGHAYGGYLRHKNGRLHKLYGIGPVKGQRLDSWRKSEIDKIRRRLPASERDAINQAIEVETRNERQRLESIRDQARAKADTAKLNAKAEYDRITSEESRIEAESKQKAKGIIESLLRELDAFKGRAAAQEAAEIEPLTRELWSLQSVVNPLRHLIKSERQRMLTASSELSSNLIKLSKSVEIAKAESSRFHSITQIGFIRHILTNSNGTAPTIIISACLAIAVCAMLNRDRNSPWTNAPSQTSDPAEYNQSTEHRRFVTNPVIGPLSTGTDIVTKSASEHRIISIAQQILPATKQDTKIAKPAIDAVGTTTASHQPDPQRMKDSDAERFHKLGLEHVQNGDYSVAMGWFLKAADLGLAKSEYNIGAMYSNGDGVAQNYSEAAKWYGKAAMRGYGPAQPKLQLMLRLLRR